MRKEKAKNLSICFGNYKNGKKKKNSKNLSSHYFVSAQGKTETTGLSTYAMQWGRYLQYESSNPCKKIGQKNKKCELLEL